MATIKGFIKNWRDEIILPITRGELVLDSAGQIALNSEEFLAKDGHPGLITAAERAMLSGNGSGGSISDLYTKVEHINNGLLFAGTNLNFYKSDGTASPINIISTGDGNLLITPSTTNNTVNIALNVLAGAETTITNSILKGITVDKFGRVTSVTNAPLTNAEIPKELTDKKITASVIDGCTTENEEIDTSDKKALANIAYVDAAIAGIEQVVTSALQFGGALTNATTAINLLSTKHYYQYKVTEPFDIPVSYLYTETEDNRDLHVKPGDTLIIYPVNGVGKFIHVPSGDDVTSITVKEEGQADAIKVVNDHLTLQFAQVFNVERDGNTQIVKISMPAASASQAGHLSQADWVRFNAYANTSITYTSTLPNTGDGIYELGKLAVGSVETPIYGRNNVSALTLENGSTTGTNQEYNPILRFSETGVATDYDIVLEGTRGIIIKKNGKKVEFRVNNVIASNSAKYLKINETTGEFEVIIGKEIDDSAAIGNNSGSITDGLTDYREFITFQNATASAFERCYLKIDNSLDDSTKDYHYGSTKLVEAITVTI